MLLMMVVMAFPVLGLGLFFWLPVPAALPVYVTVTGLAVVFHRAMAQARGSRVATGRRGMVGLSANVLSWNGHRGEVNCRSEIWAARASGEAAFECGQSVEVVECDDLTLTVRHPVSGEPPRGRDRRARGKERRAC